MMTETNSLQEILEWYICAGVDEICAEEPFFNMPKQVPAVPHVSAAQEKAAVDVPVRHATTELAQATQSAFQNARDICSRVTSLDELRQAVEAFEGCALKMTAAHTVFGDGNPQARVVFVGEAPGADEDRIGTPFVGRSGQLLDKMLAAIGLDRTSCYICNILPWRPPGNRTPLDSEIAVCLPFLKKQIDLINPEFIFTLGGSSANALLNTAETISRMRGRWLEYTKSDGSQAKLLASFHPAYLLRTPGQKAKSWADFLRLSKEMNKNS